MFEKIQNMIVQKGIKAADCEYHTIRVLENNGKIRGLVLKGEKTIHIEYICPSCGHYDYTQQEWKKASKGAKYKFETKCSKCGFLIKVSKLKGAKG
jgi:predicted RNA-binding Zn-ribbon protein involved in translation (DUF1610 family)